MLVFVLFLFLLVSGVGCGLWLWHSLDFNINFFIVLPGRKPRKHVFSQRGSNNARWRCDRFVSRDLTFEPRHEKLCHRVMRPGWTQTGWYLCFNYNDKWAASWQNQQNGMCAQRRLRSAWASAQSDQSLTVCMKKAWILSYPMSAQRRLWSDWADAQADLSLLWAHSHFAGFVTRRLKCSVKV